MMVYVTRSDWEMLALRAVLFYFVVQFQYLFEVQVHEIYMLMLHKIFVSKILLREKFYTNLHCALVNKGSEQVKNFIFYGTVTWWKITLHKS